MDAFPDHVTRVSFGRRLEPSDDVVLHGAGQDPGVGARYDPVPFRAYWDAVGDVKPALYMSYVPLRADMSLYFAGLRRAIDQYAPYRVVPQIGLYFNGDAEHGLPVPSYESETADGQLDRQIVAFRDGLRSLGRPAFVRIGFEFNGGWNGYEPEAFKAAWVRIVDAIRSAKLDDIATVWCYCPLPSSREEPGRTDRDYLPFYPGDRWVDWWSIDLFSPEMFDLDNTRWFMDDARDAGFPVMIGESTPRWVGGVGGGAAAWDRWFSRYFAFIRGEPGVKATCYINWNWDAYPEFAGWGDARIGTNELIQARYIRELADPFFALGSADHWPLAPTR